MQKKTKGRLLAVFAASTLITSPIMSTSLMAALNGATPEQTQAYQHAVQEGPEALKGFMRAFPNSPLIPQIIRALSDQIGPQAAVQAALDAGVATETVFRVAAEIAPDLFTPTGQAPNQLHHSSTGPYS